MSLWTYLLYRKTFLSSSNENLWHLIFTKTPSFTDVRSSDITSFLPPGLITFCVCVVGVQHKEEFFFNYRRFYRSFTLSEELWRTFQVLFWWNLPQDVFCHPLRLLCCSEETCLHGASNHNESHERVLVKFQFNLLVLDVKLHFNNGIASPMEVSQLHWLNI